MQVSLRTMSRPLTRIRDLGKSSRLRWRVAIAGSLLLLSVSEAGAQSNLLGLSDMVDSFGVIREQRMVDGKVPAPESPIDDFVATLFLHPDAYVRFDLGHVVSVAAIQLVAPDDAVVVETSSDGQVYQEFHLGEEDRFGKMLVFVGRQAMPEVRYIKLALKPGRTRGAAAEVLAFQRLPDELPVTLAHQEPPTFAEVGQRVLVQERWISRALFVVGALSIPILLVAMNAGRRRQVLLCSLLVVLGFAGWSRLGTFRGGGRVLHAWDQMHYYLGTKYLPELRYTELYRCLAAWEREQGRGFLVDGAWVRDLDNNRTYPGTWTGSEAGRCRSDFSAERWQEFGSDADQIRRLFTFRRMQDALRDHGYNATPFFASVWTPVLRWIPPRAASLSWLAALDLAALAGAIGALWWGFGPLAAAAGALVMGFGDPWAYTWVGGSLGRHIWLLALCAGMALLKKQRWLSGSTLLSIAGLLRLFPLVLLAGAGIQAARDLMDRRNLRPVFLVSVGVASTLLLGALLPVWVYGADVWSDFFDNSVGHGRVPSMSFMGLGVIASAGLDGSALGAPHEGEGFFWRRLAWAVGLMVAFFWLVWVQRKHSETWETIPLSAPLLFCTAPLSSYDYIWLVVLVPFIISSRLALVSLLGFVALSNLVQEFLPESRATYLVFSLGVLGVLAVFAWHASRSGPVPTRIGAADSSQELEG